MKIDMEIYKLLIDVKKIIDEDLFQINDIDEMGVGLFLEVLKSMDDNNELRYRNLVDAAMRIKKTKTNAKVEKVLQLMKYDSYEQLKKDLFYLPSVNHNIKVFSETKTKMETIYKDNPEIFYDLMDNGLLKTINSLVEKYNIPKKENQNI